MPDKRLVPNVLYAAGLGVCLALTAGCFPRSSSQRIERVPVMDGSRTKAEEDAYWRAEYEKKRPEPPKEYRVPPRPPRDNRFGEFDDGRFHGLDSQPGLPPLPADSPSLPPAWDTGAGRHSPAPAQVRVPDPLSAKDAAKASFPYDGTGRAPSAQPTRLPPQQGINTGDHFYPVEQLVFGGDYPDIDKAELYRLMPKDVITVTVKDHPEFAGQMEIQPDGTIRVPNAPDLVRLRGLTVEEAANALKQTLSVYIKGETLVRVQANRARGGYYFVFGDVLQPGRFPMGLEPVKLSEAILAANWEANPARRDIDGDELGPAFPAALPRGKFVAPHSADLARVMLITPHRSQPVRTVHDVRAAFLGVTANDPLVYPGQIIVVPSLLPTHAADLGALAPPGGMLPGQGFSTSSTPARLPEVTPNAAVLSDAAGASRWIESLPTRTEPPPESLIMSPVETNMAGAYLTNRDVARTDFDTGITVEKPVTIPVIEGPVRETYEEPQSAEEKGAGQPWPRRKVTRRARADNPARVSQSSADAVEGWKKGL